MLKHIKSIIGTTQLSKKEQQKYKGGFGALEITCPGRAITIQPYEACPDDHPILHPYGEHKCCATTWDEGGLEALESATPY